jgi:hypothetical protein
MWSQCFYQRGKIFTHRKKVMGALGGKKLAIVGSSFTNKTEEKISPNNFFFRESGNIYFKNSRQI